MEILWWNEGRGRMKIRSWQLSFICLLDYFKLIFLLTQDVFLFALIKAFMHPEVCLGKWNISPCLQLIWEKKTAFLITQLTHDVKNSQY